MVEPNFLLCEAAPGQARVLVRVEDESVWLSQAQMVDLFQTSKQNISLHIRNIFEEGELAEEGTVKEYLTVQSEGGRQVQRSIAHYNLDVIISVGYRVRSHVGTQFRIWATQRLRDYVIKGFALDDQRLKEQAAVGDYFDELLERIRDIRSSEKLLYKRVREICALSIDYLAGLGRGAALLRHGSEQVPEKRSTGFQPVVCMGLKPMLWRGFAALGERNEFRGPRAGGLPALLFHTPPRPVVQR